MAASPSSGGWRYRAAVTAAGLCLALVVVDFGLAQANRALQDDVNQRQQAINQGLTLSRVNEALIRDIAVASSRDKDAKLGALLTAQGISVSLSPVPVPAAESGQGRAGPDEAGARDSRAQGTGEGAASKRVHGRP